MGGQTLDFTGSHDRGLSRGIRVGLVLIAGSTACSSSPPIDACSATGGPCTPSADAGGASAGDGEASLQDQSNDLAAPEGGGVDSGSDAALPACPSESNGSPPDASFGACSRARALLACTAAGGNEAQCLTDDPSRCPSGALPPGAPFSCRAQCDPTEYGVSCVPPAALPASSACRSMGGFPQISFFCCSCGDAAYGVAPRDAGDAAPADGPGG